MKALLILQLLQIVEFLYINILYCNISYLEFKIKSCQQLSGLPFEHLGQKKILCIKSRA